MKRIASVAALVGALGALGACGDSNEKTTTTSASSACPTKGTRTNGAYASNFEGDVTMDAKQHVLVVTRDGQPVKGASVCVNTAMVGMKSMHYSARAREVAPGRYEVPVKFEMEGTYRGNVVTEVDDDAISVPLTVKVGSAGAMEDDKTSTETTGTMNDDEMSTTTTQGGGMTETTSGAMGDEDGK